MYYTFLFFFTLQQCMIRENFRNYLKRVLCGLQSGSEMHVLCNCISLMYVFILIQQLAFCLCKFSIRSSYENHINALYWNIRNSNNISSTPPPPLFCSDDSGCCAGPSSQFACLLAVRPEPFEQSHHKIPWSLNCSLHRFSRPEA